MVFVEKKSMQQGLWLHRQSENGQIFLASDLPKETVAAIMMLYKNMKAKVRSPEEDTDYFDIVAGVLQGDTFTPSQFIIWKDYVLRTSILLMEENCYKLAKGKK